MGLSWAVTYREYKQFPSSPLLLTKSPAIPVGTMSAMTSVTYSCSPSLMKRSSNIPTRRIEHSCEGRGGEEGDEGRSQEGRGGRGGEGEGRGGRGEGEGRGGEEGGEGDGGEEQALNSFI